MIWTTMSISTCFIINKFK